MNAAIDVRDVRATLRAAAVLAYFAIAHVVRGDELRSRVCPCCGPRSTECVSINAHVGVWFDHARGCRGDLLSMIAGYAGLNAATSFPRIVEIAAEISGVGSVIEGGYGRGRFAAASTPSHEGESRRRAAVHLSRLLEARARASVYWSRLARSIRHPAGEAFVRSRGLDPQMLVDAGHVRFSAQGDICVPLWSFEGELINVVRRVIKPAPGAPKVLGLRACPTAGSLVGRIQEVKNSTAVMLVEGVVDALTAAQLRPDGVVLGGHGAARLPGVAGAVAPVLITRHGSLLLVPDGDDIGQRAGREASEAATRAGMSIGRDLRVLDLDGHPDLNAAHLAGWRP